MSSRTSNRRLRQYGPELAEGGLVELKDNTSGAILMCPQAHRKLCIREAVAYVLRARVPRDPDDM